MSIIAAVFISKQGGAVHCWRHVHLHIHKKRYWSNAYRYNTYLWSSV